MACAGTAGISAPAWAGDYGALSLEGYGRDSFAGHQWSTQKDPTKAYAIQEDLGFTPRRHRFEVRSDDIWNGKTYINRAEFSYVGRHAHGAVIWFSYAMRIGAGPPVTNWNVLGQFHHTPDDGEAGISPPFAINFVPGEKLKFIRRYNPLPLDSQPTVATM
ncbi:MAG TPA: heparin lyase I family protein, partial [Caulobacteraceae bacterium]|nr:heparin lyase I family protein [Caulobacteraceae bacterium]